MGILLLPVSWSIKCIPTASTHGFTIFLSINGVAKHLRKEKTVTDLGWKRVTREPTQSIAFCDWHPTILHFLFLLLFPGFVVPTSRLLFRRDMTEFMLSRCHILIRRASRRSCTWPQWPKSQCGIFSVVWVICLSNSADGSKLMMYRSSSSLDISHDNRGAIPIGNFTMELH